MKIAIQGHPTRGKEVIQILESLGGKSRGDLTGRRICQYYFINSNGDIDLHYRSNLFTYKLYTLEEFEKEFPFKIGDKVIALADRKSYKIIALEHYNDKLCYKLDNSFHYQPRVLKPYKEMKEERNVTLTLDKAKEWYQKGGELKEIALQAFAEQELNPLPKSWEEYCKMYPVIPEKHLFLACCPQKYIALYKLELLRDCYRQGWKPKSKECVFAIKYAERGLNVYLHSSQEFLSFQSKEIVEEFLKNFELLIKEAGDFI